MYHDHQANILHHPKHQLPFLYDDTHEETIFDYFFFVKQKTLCQVNQSILR